MVIAQRLNSSPRNHLVVQAARPWTSSTISFDGGNGSLPKPLVPITTILTTMPYAEQSAVAPGIVLIVILEPTVTSCALPLGALGVAIVGRV